MGDQSFAGDGEWWLPDYPGRHGTGHLDATLGGITLQLVGILARPGSHPWPSEHEIVYGAVDGRAVTLARCYMGGGTMDIQRERYICIRGSIGAHQRDDRVIEASSSASYLSLWIAPRPSLTRQEAAKPAVVGPYVARIDGDEIELRTELPNPPHFVIRRA